MWYIRPKHENICMSVSQLMWYRRSNIEIYAYIKLYVFCMERQLMWYWWLNIKIIRASCSSWTRKNTFGVILYVYSVVSTWMLYYAHNKVIHICYTGKSVIGKLSEFIGGCPIISDYFIGSDKFIGWLFSV